MLPSRNTSPARTSRSAGTTRRVTASSSASVISATASALRPGVCSTGIPRAVAPAMSTLVGSPRVEPITRRGRSSTGPLTKSASHTSTVAPSASTRSASAAPSQIRSGR